MSCIGTDLIENHGKPRYKITSFLKFIAASPDQDTDENIELGLGFNVSFFQGILRLGYGWNLYLCFDKDSFYKL